MQLTNEQWIDVNEKVIEEFRANSGRCGGHLEGNPLILLTTRGVKSGRERVTPLTYLRESGRIIIFASKAGAPSDPDWFRNLQADPEVVVEIDDERFEGHASIAAPAERERLFEEMVARFPRFGGYREATGRVIPVVILERRNR